MFQHGLHGYHQIGRRIGVTLQPGEGQQVFNQDAHAVGLALHQRQRLVAAGVVQRSVAQGFDEAGQHRQRCLDLVGHIGHEIPPHGLGPLELGDVLRKEQLLLVAIGKGLHAQREHVAPALPVHMQGFVETLRLQIRDEFRVADQVHRMLAQVALHVQAEMAGRGRVAPVDLVVRVEQQHPVG